MGSAENFVNIDSKDLMCRLAAVKQGRRFARNPGGLPYEVERATPGQGKKSGGDHRIMGRRGHGITTTTVAGIYYVFGSTVRRKSPDFRPT